MELVTLSGYTITAEALILLIIIFWLVASHSRCLPVTVI